MDAATIFSLSLTLFLLMDSVGNIPFFLSILHPFSKAQQKKILKRELFIALAILLLFLAVGDVLLSLLRVKPYTLSISGGIILFLIALKMVFPQEEAHKTKTTLEPFIVPLATPLVAGPAVLASIMLYARQLPISVTLPAACIAWLATFAVLHSARHLQKILGNKGLAACERLMGLILTLIAVQMLLEGTSEYITSLTAAS
jgi:multiple antibiotic resistance protein